MKDSMVYDDNNAGLSLKYDDESRKLTGKDVLEGVCNCFFNKEHIDYHTYETENRDDIYHV